MKVNMFFFRVCFRDYYDLYVLNFEGFFVVEMYIIIEWLMLGIN